MKTKNTTRNTLIIVAALAGSLAVAGQTLANPVANQQHNLKSCGYTDTMDLSIPAGARIISLNSDALQVTQNSATEFLIQDKGDCAGSGTVTVTVGTDSNNYSTETITDGAVEMNPIISNTVNQGNFQYTGMDHDFGSYQYTLKYVNNSSK